MRITLNIEDDVLFAAKERARREHKLVGQVISELARSTLTCSIRTQGDSEPAAVFGFRPFSGGDTIVTNEMVNRLRADDLS
jgi:hypothetical protein